METHLQHLADLSHVAFGFNHNDYYGRTAATVHEMYHKYGISLSGTIDVTDADPHDSSIKNTDTIMNINVETVSNYVLSILDMIKSNNSTR